MNESGKTHEFFSDDSSVNTILQEEEKFVDS